jgi:hypothetical protein
MVCLHIQSFISVSTQSGKFISKLLFWSRSWLWGWVSVPGATLPLAVKNINQYSPESYILQYRYMHIQGNGYLHFKKHTNLILSQTPSKSKVSHILPLNSNPYQQRKNLLMKPSLDTWLKLAMSCLMLVNVIFLNQSLSKKEVINDKKAIWMTSWEFKFLFYRKK